MNKKEMSEQIIVVLNFAHDNWDTLTYSQQNKLVVALRKDIWYVSNKLTYNALMRFRKDELIDVLHDVVEAIY